MWAVVVEMVRKRRLHFGETMVMAGLEAEGEWTQAESFQVCDQDWRRVAAFVTLGTLTLCA